MKSYNDKKILLTLLSIAIFAGLSGRWLESMHAGFPETDNLNSAAALLATEQNLAPQIPVPPSVTLGFVGDIMLDRGVRAKVVKNLGGDYEKTFAQADFLKTPDIMFANLEGPVSDVGADGHSTYSFRMDPKAIPAIKDAGIDVVSFANNHVGDWGRAAFEDTLSRLHTSGILSCGAGMTKAEAATPAIIDQNGYTIGFLCFSDVGPDSMAATDAKSGILLASDPDFDAIVRSAAGKVNALIVSFHFGVEYRTTHTARQEMLAHEAIDDGAVMVVGAHPHVSEDIATYSGAPILYSLGNFVFDQNFSKETRSGLFVTATLDGRSVSDLASHTVVFDKNFVPSIKEEE